MEKHIADKTVALLREQALVDERISFEGAAVSGFHTWVDDKPNPRIFKIADDAGSYWIVFCQWNLNGHPGRHYLVVYPASKSGPIVEMYKHQDDALVWKYSPRKQDGLNEARKAAFREVLGDVEVRLTLPTQLDDVGKFVDRLLLVCHARESAHNISAGAGTTPARLARTFLMTWNPKGWEWSSEKMAEQIARLDAGERVTLRWSTGNSKKPRAGDRVVFIRLGSEGRGVFATGSAVSSTYQRPHWAADRATVGDTSNYVDAEFDELFDPRVVAPLAQQRLKSEIMETNWSPQGSGTQLKSDAAAQFEVLWQQHLMSLGTKLRFVHDESQLRDSVKSYARALSAADSRTKFGAKHCWHFVIEPTSGDFAPTKWAAYRGMTPGAYAALQEIQKTVSNPRGFSGSSAQSCADRVTEHQHLLDEALQAQLETEYERRFGADFLGPERLSKAKVLSMSPSLANETHASSGSFNEIMAALGAKGLHFAPEVVANFLLALQAKRFVIFTGISGTGKTRLALELAKYFSEPEESEAANDEEGAVDVAVQPYMLKYKRIVVPAELAATFLAEVDSPLKGRVQAEVEGSRYSLAYYAREGTHLFQVTFSAGARRWFADTFSVGDIVRLQRIESDDGTGILSMSVPTSQPRRPALRQYEVIPVRPDWTDHRGLLGFYNALTEQYVSTPFVRLLIRAHEEEQRALRDEETPRPFFAILDEMNLARVEHYFSDFLSAMESGEPIDLHSNKLLEEGESEEGIAVPRKLRVPQNLFFVGTVNVDETTYLFSPKVLDRAFTIEFNDVDLRRYGQARASSGEAELRLTKFDGQLRQTEAPGATDWAALEGLAEGLLRELVLEVNDILAGENRHFGYRVANEIGRFVGLAAEQSEGELALWAAMDFALVQKVLSKLHGTQQELETMLVQLLAFGVDGKGSDKAAEIEAEYNKSERLPKLPRFTQKVRRMLRRLRQQGFTSFVE